MGALLRFKHETGHDVSKIDTTGSEEALLLLYCCVKSACNADGVPLPDGMDFELFADKLTPEDFEAFTETLNGEKKTTSQPTPQ